MNIPEQPFSRYFYAALEAASRAAGSPVSCKVWTEDGRNGNGQTTLVALLEVQRPAGATNARYAWPIDKSAPPLSAQVRLEQAILADLVLGGIERNHAITTRIRTDEYPAPFEEATGSYGWALVQLQAGRKVARAEWGGYWRLEMLSFHFNDAPEGDHYHPFAHLKDGGAPVPAAPYWSDMLATDWRLVD